MIKLNKPIKMYTESQKYSVIYFIERLDAVVMPTTHKIIIMLQETSIELKIHIICHYILTIDKLLSIQVLLKLEFTCNNQDEWSKPAT